MGVNMEGHTQEMRRNSISDWLLVEPYPSEKYDLVSDDDIPNWMESHKIPWFQSPPTRYIVIPIINHRLTID